jgi:hypothetical protein
MNRSLAVGLRKVEEHLGCAYNCNSEDCNICPERTEVCGTYTCPESIHTYAHIKAALDLVREISRLAAGS